VTFIAEILDFSCSLGESPSSDAEARLACGEKSRISTMLALRPALSLKAYRANVESPSPLACLNNCVSLAHLVQETQKTQILQCLWGGGIYSLCLNNKG